MVFGIGSQGPTQPAAPGSAGHGAGAHAAASHGHGGHGAASHGHGLQAAASHGAASHGHGGHGAGTPGGGGHGGTPRSAPSGFEHGLSAEAAGIIIRQALAKAREHHLQPLTVVVLDGGGQLKAAMREDGASLLRPDIAWGKAYGALALGFGSRELARRAAVAPAFMASISELAHGRVVPVPGGVLVRDSHGTVLGAVGISGDSSDKDEACAVSGIRAAGLVPDTGDLG